MNYQELFNKLVRVSRDGKNWTIGILLGHLQVEDRQYWYACGVWNNHCEAI